MSAGCGQTSVGSLGEHGADRAARGCRQTRLPQRRDRGRPDVGVLDRVRDQRALLERRPGHDERHVELVVGEAAVPAVGKLRVVDERPGLGVGGVDLVQRPVVDRKDDDVGLIRAAAAEVVEGPGPQGAVGGHGARDVEAHDLPRLDQRQQRVRDLCLARGARVGAGAGHARVDQRVAVLVQDRVVGGRDAGGRALRRDQRAELAVRERRHAGRVGALSAAAEHDLVVSVDLAVVEREQDVGRVEQRLFLQRRQHVAERGVVLLDRPGRWRCRRRRTTTSDRRRWR